MLTHAPDLLPAAGNLSSELRETFAQSDEQGVHLLLGEGRDTIRAVRLPGVPGETRIAALVPLDADGFDRIDAIERLLRALLWRPVPNDTRLTPQQRHRQRQMLQATDGRMNGATIREIAIVLFGADRVAAEHWPTSTLRVTTSVLVRDGMAMIAGGYRALLRHRRQS
ncbi:MAG: DUF2285 domain-containing protein [Mesorhizobium sp.]